jgi:DNA replication protein DnaC
MEARVFKMQKSARDHQVRLQEFEDIRQVSIRDEHEKRKAERIQDFMKRIPLRFRGKSFSDYHVESTGQTRIKNLAMRYVETFKVRLDEASGMVFKGSPGTGKTLLSLIIYQQLVQSGFTVRYESSLEFIQDLVDIKFKSQSLFKSNLEAFGEIQLLIIDEVTESVSKDGIPTELQKQVLFQLINKRYENNLCTLIITNRSSHDLQIRLGMPIVDRLLEKSVTLAFDWNSYRQR